MVKLLIENGANINALTDTFKSVLDLATTDGSLMILSYLQQCKRYLRNKNMEPATFFNPKSQPNYLALDVFSEDTIRMRNHFDHLFNGTKPPSSKDFALLNRLINRTEKVGPVKSGLELAWLKLSLANQRPISPFEREVIAKQHMLAMTKQRTKMCDIFYRFK